MSENNTTTPVPKPEANQVPPPATEPGTSLAPLPTPEADQPASSEAPSSLDTEWMKSAEQLPQNKQQITLRIDADVLAFFRSTGKRYQSRMNAVLRAYVEAQKANA